MLNFDFLRKGPEIVSPPYFVDDFQEKCYSSYILLTNQISFSDCLFFTRYWIVCVLQFLVNQVVMS